MKRPARPKRGKFPMPRAILKGIPTCSGRDPIHRDYFARRQGADCAAVPAPQAQACRFGRNAAFGQKNPAFAMVFGDMKPTIGCVAPLARC